MKLRLKLFWFLNFFSVGIFGPYLAVYLYRKGFSGGQIGLFLGAMPIATIIFQPVWSYLSDTLQTRRLLLLIGSLGAGMTAVILGFIESYLATFLLGLFFAAMNAPLNTIITAIVLDYLEQIDEVNAFSLVRLWGSLGFAASSIIMGGLFLDQILTLFTWILAGVYLSLAVLSLLLPEGRQTFTYTGLKDLKILTENSKFTIFLLGSIFIGATFGIQNNYQTLFLQSLDASTWMIGFIVSFQALAEVPVMIAVPYLSKFLSLKWLILLGAILLPVRWFLYTFIRQPVWIIPTQLINGFAVVSFFVAAITFIDQSISPKWRATGQALYGTAMMGIGSGLGVYFAGIILDRFGVRNIWYLSFALGLVGLILIAIALSKHSPSNGDSER